MQHLRGDMETGVATLASRIVVIWRPLGGIKFASELAFAGVNIDIPEFHVPTHQGSRWTGLDCLRRELPKFRHGNVDAPGTTPI